MKKILFIFLLGIIVIPFNTYAATINNNNTYQVKCKIYNVDTSNDRSVLDYFYYTYFYTMENHENLNFMLFKTSLQQQYSFYIFSSDYTLGGSTGRNLSATTNCLYNGNSGNFTCTTNTNTIPTETSTISFKYSNVSLLGYTSNITSSDIESSYQDYCNIPNVNVNVDFPFTKNEFYTLLILIGTIIMMLFLKWTFPMKGGRKL